MSIQINGRKAQPIKALPWHSVTFEGMRYTFVAPPGSFSVELAHTGELMIDAERTPDGNVEVLTILE